MTDGYDGKRGRSVTPSRSLPRYGGAELPIAAPELAERHGAGTLLLKRRHVISAVLSSHALVCDPAFVLPARLPDDSRSPVGAWHTRKPRRTWPDRRRLSLHPLSLRILHI
ncbi:hypothetical protein SKAU_G00384210 [Synaphobranchus kaupii]|uniref:Uncharacterized protein n=1 Tax=Synaphobranchus kaupii TaxID=118154 RepID=A0A9Q1IF26_SYNKA|nr:hypothetical protein SKAU_G00384210 [Synaphobranchus kaupii]